MGTLSQLAMASLFSPILSWAAAAFSASESRISAALSLSCAQRMLS